MRAGLCGDALPTLSPNHGKVFQDSLSRHAANERAKRLFGQFMFGAAALMN